MTGRAANMGVTRDVLIVGGGLNGPAQALALAQAGLTVTLIDAQPLPAAPMGRFDGRAYALALGSQRMLAALGVWDGIAADAQPIASVRTGDGRAGEAAAALHMNFAAADIDEPAMGFLVEHRVLRPALLAAVAASARILHLTGAEVVAQLPDSAGISVTLRDGSDHAGRLLIGCDGRTSGTARRAGIARSIRDYAQTALVCAIAHALPHHGTAQQLFLPGGPLAVLPLTGNRCSVVWTERRDTACALAQMDDPGFLAALRLRLGDFLGDVTLIGARHDYPLSLSLAARLTGARLALVGDAAHGVHPIAGQGLNLGLRDVAALRDVLVAARRRGEDIGAADVLVRYQRWRGFDSGAMAAGTDAVNTLFSNDVGAVRTVRDLGMGAVNALPALRRAFIRQAAGISGDLPRLMQG